MPVAAGLHVIELASPVLVALIYIACCSLIKEPGRREFNAVMVAGAGAAYLNGGLGAWEFAFTPILTFLAYKGLRDYRPIGIAWVLHAIWDAVHHRYGTPIVPFVATSSLGCAICDPVLALWCFAGGPSVFAPFAGRRGASVVAEAGDTAR